MVYKNFCGNDVSTLGMGCMRFPVKDDAIDEAAVAEMFEYAISASSAISFPAVSIAGSS